MANLASQKNIVRIRRHARVRSKISGTSTLPRLSVFRSNRALYAQLIDDEKNATIAAASSVGVKKGTKSEKAEAIGKAIAHLAKEKKITHAVFDRGGFRYAGNIKALAESARKEGLTL